MENVFLSVVVLIFTGSLCTMRLPKEGRIPEGFSSIVTGLNGVVCIISTLSQENLLEVSLHISLFLSRVYLFHICYFLFNENSFSEGNKEEDKSLIQNQLKMNLYSLNLEVFIYE